MGNDNSKENDSKEDDSETDLSDNDSKSCVSVSFFFLFFSITSLNFHIISV